METGFKYMISKEGLIKLLVIAFGCITFALLADTRSFRGSARMEWVFAAFVISCAVSVLFYIFRVSGVSNKMGTCGPCTFDGFDYIWSWFCTIWCLAAAIAFATVFPQNRRFTPWYNKLISSIVFAFATGIAYAVEAYILRSKAPANIGYISTRHGWLKTIIVALGCAAFALLVDSGYAWCGRRSSCYAGITYALVAFIVAWAVTTIVWIIHITGLLSSDRRSSLRKFEFYWAIIGVLLFFSASSCFAAYMGCGSNQFRNNLTCQKRLAGVIIGFLTGVLYIIEAVLLRP